MKKPSRTHERKLTFFQREQIVNLHFEKRISQTQLSKDFNVSRQTISRYCRFHGESPLTNYKLDDTEIIKMFNDERMSVKAIADKLGITTRPIKLRLTLAGIDYRPRRIRKTFAKEVTDYFLKMKIWGFKVIERDGLCCKWCKAKYSHENRLEAHHIKAIRYMKNPDELFNLNNGITLCRKCHMKVHYKEKEFEIFFNNLIQRT
jgi:transcriptional regulator with XRE-family HTH domain